MLELDTGSLSHCPGMPHGACCARSACAQHFTHMQLPAGGGPVVATPLDHGPSQGQVNGAASTALRQTSRASYAQACCTLLRIQRAVCTDVTAFCWLLALAFLASEQPCLPVMLVLLASLIDGRGLTRPHGCSRPCSAHCSPPALTSGPAGSSCRGGCTGASTWGVGGPPPAERALAGAAAPRPRVVLVLQLAAAAGSEGRPRWAAAVGWPPWAGAAPGGGGCEGARGGARRGAP